MKKLTFSLVIAIVLVSGLALAESSAEKASEKAIHSCSVSSEACTEVCPIAAGNEDAVTGLLVELTQEKIQADRYAAIQADVDLLLETIDFD